MPKVIGAVLLISIYSALTFYLGWGVKQWLVAMGWFRFPVLFWVVLYMVAFSIIIGRLHESLRVFSVISNYWMFIFEYGLLLCLVAQFIIWLTPFKNVQIIGSIAVAILFLLSIIGSYLAYSPVVRHLEITVDKQDSDLNTL
ncbi:MAG: hypothetical protein M3Z48_09540, partial [Lactobacillus sp.]|nr:hypothetical protein [Lactobacillus sp.]